MSIQALRDKLENGQRIEWKEVAAALEAYDALRKALEQVEWRASGAHLQCLWCHELKQYGHKPTCARQAALSPETKEAE